MATTNTFSFGSLYDYSTTKGIVIPQTSDIKTKIEECFKTIFGNDFDTTPETIGGRLIEALTLLFIDVLGVNAQNASFLNPNFAEGIYLDRIGEIFGVERGDSTDAEYREKILNAQSTGVGFEKAITRKVSQVTGVTSVVVYNNGDPDPAVMPSNGDANISVDGHSVYICVGGGSNKDVAEAIKDSISAGCGYTNAKSSSDSDSTEYGTKVEYDWTDAETGSSCTVRFYRPIQKQIRIVTDVVNVNHSASTIVADVQDIIDAYIWGDSSYGFSAHNANCVLTTAELSAAIAGRNSGAYVKSAKIYVRNDSDTAWIGEDTECSKVTFFPYNACSLEDTDNVVNVI